MQEMILILEVDPDLRGESTQFSNYVRDWKRKTFEEMLWSEFNRVWTKPPLFSALDILFIFYFSGQTMAFMTYPPSIAELTNSCLRMMEGVCVNSQNQVCSIVARKEWSKEARIEIFINAL